jgi:dipeptidyl aminopeptidase/acylaminoacyl peptidase
VTGYADVELALEDLFFALTIPHDARLAPDERLVAYVEARPDRERNGFRRTLRVIDAETGADAAPGSAPAGRLPRWLPDARTLVFVCDADGDEPAGIFRWAPGEDAPPRRVCAADGVSDLVSSPDGREIAFVGAAPVARDPLAPLVFREGGFRVNGSPLPFDPPQLFVVDADGGEPRGLTRLGAAVGSPCWSPDGGRVAFAAGIQAHDPSHAYVLERDGGALRRVSPEGGECYAVAWTPAGDELLLTGRRDARVPGHARLFLQPLDGGAPRELAPELDRGVALSGGYDLGARPCVSADGRHALFAAPDRARVRLFRAPLDGGPAEALPGGETDGVRGVSAGPTRLVTVVARACDPGDVVVANADGSAPRRLTALNDPTLLARIAPPQERWFTAPDGTEIHALVLRDPAVQGPTPLVLDIHGGPHDAWVLPLRDVELYNWEFVARGFTVLLVNPRGSVGYGDAFQTAVQEAWGPSDMQDFIACVDGLIEEGLVDPDRLAVTGYSYGGYMTNYLIAHTDRFAAAVSQASASDMLLGYGASEVKHTLVREMGGPPTAERLERYDRMSPLRRADRVTTPTLFFTGMEDQTTPPAHAEAMFTLLRDLGCEAELVLYPGADHMGSGWPLSQRLDAWRRIVGWVTRHLPG